MLVPNNAFANGPILEVMVSFGAVTVGVVVAFGVALRSIIKIQKDTSEQERRGKIIRTLGFLTGHIVVIFALASALFFIWVQS
jgi:hypothetical protein